MSRSLACTLLLTMLAAFCVTLPSDAGPSLAAQPTMTASEAVSVQMPVSPAYRSSVSVIGPKLKARMRYTHRSGCPVPLRDLRYVRVSHWGFAGKSRLGELVVHRTVARQVTRAFRTMYDARFRIARMRLVDDYRGSDARSMAANNTSAFNCRLKQGSKTSWSEHSYGKAIDINPVQNPYVKGKTVLPAAGRGYLDRTRWRKGMIVARGTPVRAFGAVGWGWGGAWRTLKDYQHFSLSGR